MQTNVDILSPQPTSNALATKTLTFAASTWLIIATAGQWAFGFYILLFYGKAAIAGDFEHWNKVLPHGYVPGDWKGNLIVAIHVLLAAIMVIGGPLQLFPSMRQYFPVFHRWLGRIYIFVVFLVSTAGLTMVWTRGAVGDSGQHISISIQAVYIIVFALLAFRYARRRQFAAHRIWALRLFMVVNGVWFFRVGLMFWLMVNGGPVGFDPETFSGPFLTLLAIFTYAIPLSLIILELYFYAQRKQTTGLSFFTATIIFVFTIIMGIGIIGAAMGMWLPRV
ncbi:DUF2306 domain-containing protein [Emticicia sp. BO119]|uniref:DUF2306 domain-containing protein n=1 Tax=Emticicia sp. BO119 TaxID=2757768 RepID=UPI0015F11369|nr:DUF2306 domain-containing protein [Emticicia sp. BO119]MBA4851285.1 DUF2306 domain-containing protein [Emticicia sp. BO119]